MKDTFYNQEWKEAHKQIWKSHKGHGKAKLKKICSECGKEDYLTEGLINGEWKNVCPACFYKTI